jgi:hypothetical protein
MKFINYLQSISGVGIFPLISLLLFFVFFAAVTWYVFSGQRLHRPRKPNSYE